MKKLLSMLFVLASLLILSSCALELPFELPDFIQDIIGAEEKEDENLDDNQDNTTDSGTINEETPDLGDGDKDEETVITYSYALNKTSIVVEEEQSQKLLVIVSPEKEISPVFESSDSSVAAVAKDGTVTAEYKNLKSLVGEDVE